MTPEFVSGGETPATTIPAPLGERGRRIRTENGTDSGGGQSTLAHGVAPAGHVGRQP